LSAKCVIVVVIVTDGLLLIVLICEFVDVTVKYEGVCCADILDSVVGEIDDDNVTVCMGDVLGYGEMDPSLDCVICGETELLIVVEPDSEETCVFVFAVVALGLAVCEGGIEEVIVTDWLFELVELELI